MESDHSGQVSTPPQLAPPHPASPQSDPLETPLAQPDASQSEPPRSEPNQHALCQSYLGDANKCPPRCPRPRRRNPRRCGPVIQAIAYRQDPKDPARLIRKPLELVFPDGDTWREPLTEERSGYVRVVMEPESRGIVWMSRHPIHFTSPHGIVLPFGKNPEESLHILYWVVDKEPRHVTPDLFPPSRSQRLPNQPFPGQPLPPLNQQQFSAAGPCPQPHIFNDYQHPQEMSTLETPFQASPITPVSLSNGAMGTMRPVGQAHNHQVGVIPLPPQYQMPQAQGVRELYQSSLAQQGAWQHAPVPDRAPEFSLDLMNVQYGELDPYGGHMADVTQFPGGEVFYEEILG